MFYSWCEIILVLEHSLFCIIICLTVNCLLFLMMTFNWLVFFLCVYFSILLNDESVPHISSPQKASPLFPTLPQPLYPIQAYPLVTWLSLHNDDWCHTSHLLYGNPITGSGSGAVFWPPPRCVIPIPSSQSWLGPTNRIQPPLHSTSIVKRKTHCPRGGSVSLPLSVFHLPPALTHKPAEHLAGLINGLDVYW